MATGQLKAFALMHDIHHIIFIVEKYGYVSPLRFTPSGLLGFISASLCTSGHISLLAANNPACYCHVFCIYTYGLGLLWAAFIDVHDTDYPINCVSCL